MSLLATSQLSNTKSLEQYLERRSDPITAVLLMPIALCAGTMITVNNRANI
jgi:adenosylmethionine-8-amino-7-oxononanoate aminotransferase